ncbi:PTS system, beta-glucoside-specific IIB component / PTS system, beta-glucoside-specific IIC component / PTS system, beta-glucoside-specific IIA component [Corynebacterium glutamicum]|uniref:beta-glucoside-specific PTS transporter subunit IIABC n=1 Tax=Corynebacterium glutamicum TaxID=1718 RepID=UPI00097ECDE3|nr:beta-glucoside-specific PTS transporter subunit IIABC [Corynebacterium glutamicum]SJM50638.1 PTS system, beta-glucoside-specific IIB component / PTS system, beta-glucoside-specific IIC component / PTS system, beta-glucoside-specific IIA component [Corynebacterium glutamicum]
MATKTDFSPLVADVVTALGGVDNVRSVTHCATRLRFKIKDSDKADIAKAGKISGVITAINSGGQHQVVIGNDVPLAYQALMNVPGMRAKGVKDGDAEVDDDGGSEDKNWLNKFIDLISALFSPIVWALAGIGLGKAGLTLATTVGILDAESSTHTIFNAMFDGLFYFLPFFLAVTAAKRFKVNQFIALAIVAALLHPTMEAMVGTEGVTFLGLPLTMMSYSSSVIPVVVSVWLAGYLQRWLEKVLPGAIRNFFTPLIVVLVMVPVVLFTIGPVTIGAANALSAGIGFLFETVPWLAGGLLGAFWQVFVMFGLHWGLIPVMINDIATQGFSYMMAPLMAAIFGQVGAALAVWIRSKDAEVKKVAGPGVLSGFFAGVTEPIIYGVNLPLKYPFYAGAVAGGIGGIIIAVGGNAFDAFVFPSAMAFAATLSIGSFVAQLIGSAAALILGFVLTVVLFRKGGGVDKRVDKQETDTTPNVAAAASGTYVPLAEIPDKVFSSGAMGDGFGIVPENGEIVSPVEGQLIAVQKSGHAYGIRGDNGIEVLVHVGIDTVKMAGEGFDVMVARGDHVKVGQPLAKVNLDAVAQAGFDPTTAVIVTNSKKLEGLTFTEVQGHIDAGDVVMRMES